MNGTHWAILILVIVTAGWMAFDGTKALVTGDYVTPSKGRYAGQLGPWSRVVSAVGIEPRSDLMKSIFAFYGFVTIVILLFFLVGFSWAWWALLIAATLGLWYLPFGTAANLIVIALLLVRGRSA